MVNRQAYGQMDTLQCPINFDYVPYKPYTGQPVLVKLCKNQLNRVPASGQAGLLRVLRRRTLRRTLLAAPLGRGLLLLGTESVIGNWD